MSVVARDLLAPGLTVAIPDQYVPEPNLRFSEFSRDAGPLRFRLAEVVEVSEDGAYVLVQVHETVTHGPRHRALGRPGARLEAPQWRGGGLLIPQGWQVWVERWDVHDPTQAHEAAAKEAEHKRLQRVVADEFGDARGLNPMWLARVAALIEEANTLRSDACQADEILMSADEEAAVLAQVDRATAEMKRRAS